MVTCRQCDREKWQQAAAHRCAALFRTTQSWVTTAVDEPPRTSWALRQHYPSDYAGFEVYRSSHGALGSYQVPNKLLHQHNLLKLK